MTDPYARYTRLKFDRPHPKVLRITMENGRMNTTDAALHAELGDIWRDVDRDASVNAAILTGAGKVFSAGGDFAIIQENIDDFSARTRQWKEAREIVYNVINCSKPVVSAMRGVAVGAGLVCGILADVSIATKDCRIIDGHTRLGVAAGDHAAIVWPLLCGLAKAKYYLLTCDQILGEEAERIGLITFAVDDDQLEAKSIEVATKLAEGAQSAIRWTKIALNMLCQEGRSDASVVGEHLAMGDLAEPLGFDSLFALEHHFTGYAMSPSPLQLLSYYAGRTKRIHLGTAVIVIPWHDPIRIAEQIALLDVLSGGRCLFGFGRGAARIEYEGFRIPMDEARPRFKEGLDIIRLGLTQESFEYQGQFFTIPRTSIRPGPVSHPELRFYGSANSPESAKLLASSGLGLLIVMHNEWPKA